MPAFIWVIWCLCLLALSLVYWKDRKSRRAWEKYRSNISPEMLELGRALREEVQQASSITVDALAAAVDSMYKERTNNESGNSSKKCSGSR